MAFQTTFHLAADQDLTIEVDDVNKQVSLTVHEGTHFDVDDPTNHRNCRQTVLFLSRGRTRAIASALMGAAAEV